MTGRRQPAGAPTGGQFVPSARDEPRIALHAAADKSAPEPAPGPLAPPPTVGDVNDWTEDDARHWPGLDPGLYKSRLHEENVRAHAIRVGDNIVLDGRHEQVIAKRQDAPGHPGRMVHLTTENGEHHFPLNDCVAVSRGTTDRD